MGKKPVEKIVIDEEQDDDSVKRPVHLCSKEEEEEFIVAHHDMLKIYTGKAHKNAIKFGYMAKRMTEKFYDAREKELAEMQAKREEERAERQGEDDEDSDEEEEDKPINPYRVWTWKQCEAKVRTNKNIIAECNALVAQAKKATKITGGGEGAPDQAQREQELIDIGNGRWIYYGFYMTHFKADPSANDKSTNAGLPAKKATAKAKPPAPASRPTPVTSVQGMPPLPPCPPPLRANDDDDGHGGLSDGAADSGDADDLAPAPPIKRSKVTTKASAPPSAPIRLNARDNKTMSFVAEQLLAATNQGKPSDDLQLQIHNDNMAMTREGMNAELAMKREELSWNRESKQMDQQTAMWTSNSATKNNMLNQAVELQKLGVDPALVNDIIRQALQLPTGPSSTQPTFSTPAPTAAAPHQFYTHDTPQHTSGVIHPHMPSYPPTQQPPPFARQNPAASFAAPRFQNASGDENVQPEYSY